MTIAHSRIRGRTNSLRTPRVQNKFTKRNMNLPELVVIIEIGPDFQDGFEFIDNWDETVSSIPAPTFPSINYDEDFDSTWSGT